MRWAVGARGLAGLAVLSFLAATVGAPWPVAGYAIAAALAAVSGAGHTWAGGPGEARPDRPEQARRAMSPLETFAGLRQLALTARPEQVGLALSADLPHVWAVLMEFRRREAVVSLVCVADGTVSLYVSTGGGVLGAGGHATVSAAARAFLRAAEAAQPRLARATDTAWPAPGRVRFFVRTFDGTLVAERDEAALAAGRDDLAPLWRAGQAVLARVGALRGAAR